MIEEKGKREKTIFFQIKGVHRWLPEPRGGYGKKQRRDQWERVDEFRVTVLAKEAVELNGVR